ncbi:hypothetical protein SEA_RAVENPUFF_49 [Streptomyces phage RavenPuff]|nr:hypothetical protein SEA_RAVENPUFF_49 [Streptomyces phage RavenPuff]UVK63639.1 membrane protein [Streptomyces phage Doxi13]
MPQPEDYLAAYVLLLMVMILGCGAAVIAIIAAIDHFMLQYKRRQLRNARR